MNNTIYTLRVFQGKETYDAKGNVTSENNLMKIESNTKQFDQFLKAARNFYTRIEVLKATDGKNELEIDPAMKSLLEDCVKAPQKELSADEKRIKELEAAVAQLMAASQSKSVAKEVKTESTDDSELESLRLEYLQVLGEKPNHLLKAGTLRKKIAEFKESNPS